MLIYKVCQKKCELLLLIQVVIHTFFGTPFIIADKCLLIIADSCLLIIAYCKKHFNIYYIRFYLYFESGAKLQTQNRSDQIRQIPMSRTSDLGLRLSVMMVSVPSVSRLENQGMDAI